MLNRQILKLNRLTPMFYSEPTIMMVIILQQTMQLCSSATTWTILYLTSNASLIFAMSFDII